MAPDESGGESAFEQALSELKCQGSNLLVVGPPALAAHSGACDRLLGDADGTRRRLFVETQDSQSAASRTAYRDARVVRYPGTTRSTAAETPPSDSVESGGPREYRVETDDLGALASAIEREIDAIAADGNGLDPGELRVCVGSLLPIIADHSSAEAERFLSTVCREVLSVNGMAHYHLPVPSDDEHVSDLTPAFDAVISLRYREDHPEQRWNVPEADLDSGWLPL